jgi:drug/metabolite transporter (DMT)-like permease
VTLAAALFLGEPVGWRRYLAISVGFLGVLIIVRPGAEGFNAYALWAVASLFFLVLRDLTTRRFSPRLPSVFAVFITATGITIMGGAMSLTQPWRPVEGEVLAILGTASVCLVFGYLFSVMAMRIGEIAFVSPFRYLILIWAILIGIFVFGDLPDGYTLLGSAIVVGTGIYTFYREQRRRRREGREKAKLLAAGGGPSVRP